MGIIKIHRKHFIGLVMTTLIACITNSCDEDTIVLRNPSVKIISAVNKALSEFEITVEIDKGEGQKLINAELFLEDITIKSMDKLVFQIQLSDEMVQQHKITVNTNRLNHDFVASARLITDKFVFTSNNQIIRTFKSSFNPKIVSSGRVMDDFETMIMVNSGEKFYINIECQNQVEPKSIEVKLNTGSSLPNTINFKQFSYLPDGILVGGEAQLPADIAPGVYDVSVIIDGFSFNCANKLRVLSGKWNIFDQSFPGAADERGFYAWFKLNDKLYVVGGERYARQIPNAPVYSLDLKTKIWTRLHDFPYDFTNADYIISPLQLIYNNEGYILVYNRLNSSHVELWKYKPLTDIWEKITEYPGKGYIYLTGFIVGDQLFTGGGNRISPDSSSDLVPCQDFWAYHFETQQWTRKNNLPFLNVYYPASCTSASKGYVLEDTQEFWEYDPPTDKWKEKRKYPGLMRRDAYLVADGNTIYLTGGNNHEMSWISLDDCWSYQITSDTWDMIAFLPFSTPRGGISFIYNNKIIWGLGYNIDFYYFGKIVNYYTLYEYSKN